MDRKHFIFFFVLATVLCLSACSRVIYPPIVEVHPTITKYRYVYIVPTSGLISGDISTSSWAVSTSNASASRMYSSAAARSYSSSSSNVSIRTTNPADVISGDLMARGYAVLPELNPDLLDKTMVVNYGETDVVAHNGRIYNAVVLQLRDAKTAELVSSVKADGQGTRDAILRALDGVFLVATPYFKHPTSEQE